jgi:hypothetical protein
MNEQELNVSNKTLTSIKEKLFAGKAAFESDELEKLCKQIENEMNSAIKNQSVCKNDEISKEWLEIFESISIGDFADTLFSSLDKENFYDFGNHLIEEKVNYP